MDMSENVGTLQLNEGKVPEKMNLFQRLWNLFLNPKRLFAYTAKKPSLLFPVIVICILSLAAMLLTMEQIYEANVDVLYNTWKTMGSQVPMDQIQSLARTYAIGTVAGTPFIMVATWLVTTLILYLVFRLAKCEKGLKKYFSMMAYIMIISLTGQLMTSAYMYFTGAKTLDTMVTSIASLIDAGTVGNFVYGVAKNIEVFNIWTYILYGIGFVYTGGAKKRAAYIISAVLFVIVTAASAGMYSLTANLSNLYF